MCRLTLAIPAYSWDSADAWQGPAYVLSCVLHAYKQGHVLICVYERRNKHRQYTCEKCVVSVYTIVR